MNASQDVSAANSRVIPGDAIDIASQAVTAFHRGDIVGIPTDTVYGLAAAIDRPDALERLYRLKGRPLEKAIPVLISDIAHIGKVASQFPDVAFLLAARFWPGGLTLVVPARADLPHQVTAPASDGKRTVAVRIPDHALARAMIEAAGGALAVTSANRSGEPPCCRADDVAALGASAPDVVIDGGPAPGGVPSTIVSVVTGVPIMLREGAVAGRDIAEAANVTPLRAGAV